MLFSKIKAYYLTCEAYQETYTHILLVPENVDLPIEKIEKSYLDFLKENPIRNDWTTFFNYLTFDYAGVIYINTRSPYVEFEGLAYNEIALCEDRFKRIALEKALADAEEQVQILKEKLDAK